MMNRLQSPSSRKKPSFQPPVRSVAAGKFHFPTALAEPALFAPLHYEQGYAYPLVVWLHGSGGSAAQLRQIMPLISLRNFIAVAPEGTQAMTDNREQKTGYRWEQTSHDISEAQQRVQCAIAVARRQLNIRPDRIFVAGYECGGTMAFRLATQRPEQFAGVISLGGPFPTQGAPLANLSAMRRLPLFVASSRQGSSYPSEQVCADLRLFHSAGMSITLRDYPGEDGLSPSMLADVNRWIMEQISTPSSLVDVSPPRETGVG